MQSTMSVGNLTISAENKKEGIFLAMLLQAQAQGAKLTAYATREDSRYDNVNYINIPTQVKLHIGFTIEGDNHA